MINSSTILPAESDKQYLLCYMKYYLENCKSETFTSNEIAEETDGLFKGFHITRLLTKYNLKSKKTTLYNPNGTYPTVYIYNTKMVLNILQELAIDSFNLLQLNDAIRSKNRVNVSKQSINTLINGRGIQSENFSSIPIDVLLDFVYPSFTPEDVFAYHQETNFNYHYYYELSHALKNILEVDVETKCLNVPKDFPRDKSHYPLLTPKLLKHLNLPMDITQFQTRQLSRIITQTFNPLLDYNGLEGHHICRIRGEENRACCNPAHLTPATKPKHIAFHNRVGDDHAHNDPTQTFQIVETNTLNQPPGITDFTSINEGALLKMLNEDDVTFAN